MPKKIAIIGGCGHVGFPLGLALAKGKQNYAQGGGGNWSSDVCSSDLLTLTLK